MSLRSLLLASVSALTLMLGNVAARAGDGTFVVGVSGGYIMGDNGTIKGFEETGPFQDLNYLEHPEQSGNYFSVMVGKEVMPMWDIRARLSATHVDPALADLSYGEADKLGQLGTGLDYQTLDIETGYTPALADDFELRFVAGVRALHAVDKASLRDKIGQGPYETYETWENTFTGVGPRIALEGSKRFADTPFGISASAGGSVLFGELDRKTSGELSDTVDRTVVMIDGKVALDYYLGDFGKVSLGYRGEVLSGTTDFQRTSADLPDHSFDGTQLTHGAVLEFLGQF